jgi:tetratricopeptide (TPR) repeat protein
MEYEGDFSKAILFYTRALPLAGAYLNRGRLFAERKQFKRAKEDFWAAIKQAKGDTEIRKKAFFNLVLIYLKEGKKKKAKEILKMMVE